jgi:hypothetical protein
MRGRKKEKTGELVYEAIRSGFKGIDTACQPKVRSDCLTLLRRSQENLQRRDIEYREWT